MNSKQLNIVLIIALIVAVGVAGYFAIKQKNTSETQVQNTTQSASSSQTPNQSTTAPNNATQSQKKSSETMVKTTAANTCTNNNLGVLFQYPKGWYIWKTNPPYEDPKLVPSCNGDTSELVFSQTNELEQINNFPKFTFVTNQGMNAAEKGQRFYGAKSADDIASVLSKSIAPVYVIDADTYRAGGEKVIRWAATTNRPQFSWADTDSSQFSWVHLGVVYELGIQNNDNDSTAKEVLQSVTYIK